VCNRSDKRKQNGQRKQKKVWHAYKEDCVWDLERTISARGKEFVGVESKEQQQNCRVIKQGTASCFDELHRSLALAHMRFC
jgi:hypothetical protein